MPPSERLFRLAVMAQTDRDAIPVLHDAMLEEGWTHPAIMAVALGFDLAPRRPYFHNARQRENWERARDRDLGRARACHDEYAGRSPAWAKAVLAAMLFGDWPPARKRRYGPWRTASPFALVRAHYDKRLARTRAEYNAE